MLWRDTLARNRCYLPVSGDFGIVSGHQEAQNCKTQDWSEAALIVRVTDPLFDLVCACVVDLLQLFGVFR